MDVAHAQGRQTQPRQDTAGAHDPVSGPSERLDDAGKPGRCRGAVGADPRQLLSPSRRVSGCGAGSPATPPACPATSNRSWCSPPRRPRRCSLPTARPIYDVSSSGAVGAAAVSGLTNARHQHTMFATSGGQFLVICNGADGVRTYDGTVVGRPHGLDHRHVGSSEHLHQPHRPQEAPVVRAARLHDACGTCRPRA